MKNLMEYKGYCGSVEYSQEDDVLHGKVLGITSMLSYEGDSLEELKGDFQNAIDEYLELCELDGIEPEKTYKGSFNVRIKPELHKKAVLFSQSKGVSLNTVVEEAIEHYVM